MGALDRKEIAAEAKKPTTGTPEGTENPALTAKLATRELIDADASVESLAVRKGGEAAFDRARLLAQGQKCDCCGEFKQYPEGVALYEEPYCEDKWFCLKCYPESEPDDE
ncbi:hypothetical protein GMLC_21700 [Geomonas limicola]|uniref:Uncharacterized protein n=1 Tax=Geomonas limicola TaxID=2740186 RepID=A0A6V8N7V8_9BACT|nr:hypothetical protein [Geomonas limicola]GFO68591.1 hypothetical protein GMLC_21700 [Geomonas limicola]